MCEGADKVGVLCSTNMIMERRQLRQAVFDDGICCGYPSCAIIQSCVVDAGQMSCPQLFLVQVPIHFLVLPLSFHSLDFGLAQCLFRSVLTVFFASKWLRYVCSFHQKARRAATSSFVRVATASLVRRIVIRSYSSVITFVSSSSHSVNASSAARKQISVILLFHTPPFHSTAERPISSMSLQ